MTPRIRCVVVIALVLTALMACTTGEDVDATNAVVPTDPVVVYAAYADKTYLPVLMDAFMRESGIGVIIRHGEESAIVDDVIADNILPPADVLWTASVAGIWRAAEEGALRPLRSQFVAEKMPAWLRDPDDFWVGISYRTAVLVYDPGVINASDLSDYASLAEPRFRDQLCLSSSDIAINQTVIAMLIDVLDVRPAEIAVRGWMANLARPVFDSEDALLDAIRSGTCGVGIASSSAVAAARASDRDAAIAVHVPALTYADAEAVGVARHARNPGGATALVEWLSASKTQSRHAAGRLSFPANSDASHASTLDKMGRDRSGSRHVIFAAWQRDAAIKLAERARYR